MIETSIALMFEAFIAFFQAIDPKDAIGLGPWALSAVLIVKLLISSFQQMKQESKIESLLKQINESLKSNFESLSDSMDVNFDDLIEKNLGSVSKKVEELYNWHNITDSDGVRIWYIRRSLSEAIQKLTDTISLQTQILNSLTERMREVERNNDSLKEHQKRAD